MIARTLAATTLGVVVLGTTTLGAHALWSVQPTASVPVGTPVIETPTQFACAVRPGGGWTLTWSSAPGAAATSYEVTSVGNLNITTTATTVVLGNEHSNKTVRVAAVYGAGPNAWESGTTSGFQLRDTGCRSVR